MSDDHKVGMAAIICVTIVVLCLIAMGALLVHGDRVSKEKHYVACTTIRDDSLRAACLSPGQTLVVQR